MLLTKTVIVKWNSFTKKWYEDRGYNFTRVKDEFEVKIEDLQYGCSSVHVDAKCDNCGKTIKHIIWQSYKRVEHENGKYYCRKCGTALFGKEKRMETLLKNGKSFEQWCIDNNRQDVLDRWDYELNNKKPNEISYGTKIKYYFKCPRGLHLSELKSINAFTSGYSDINCKMCNSFAQWGYDNIDENFLEKYWDYNKNNKLNINPWKISYGSKKKVYIKCQEKKYHDYYDISCNEFIRGRRCSYCRGFKVHPLDSLGKLLEDKGLLGIWSDKNKKSSYEYMPFSMKKVWWKCIDDIHKDYYRKISESNQANFHCPECQHSEGEIRIGNYLKINNISNIPQKEFDGLMGLGNGNLSYDFYLEQYNLLVEFQGQFHDGSTGEYSKINLKQQQEHDRRKKEYAKNHNIKLLEIWYWDYDNIEKILEKELKINNDLISNQEYVNT